MKGPGNAGQKWELGPSPQRSQKCLSPPSRHREGGERVLAASLFHAGFSYHLQIRDVWELPACCFEQKVPFEYTGPFLRRSLHFPLEVEERLSFTVSFIYLVH